MATTAKFSDGAGLFCYTKGMQVKLEHMPEFAKDVLVEVARHSNTVRGGAFVLALAGDLGAGKTTLTQHLARELGVTDPVQSPTYILMRNYPIEFGKFKTLIHIDAYRLERPEQFSALKPDEFLDDPKNLVVVEWPERVVGVLPKPDMILRLKAGKDSDTRHVQIG